MKCETGGQTQNQSLQLKKAIGKERKAVSLFSITGKIQKQIIKQSIYKHLQDDKVIKISQHRFVKNKLCQPNLISFFDRLNGFVDKRRQQM